MSPRMQGVAWSVTGSAVFVVHDAISKQLVAAMPAEQIMALRGLAALAPVVGLALALGHGRDMLPRSPRLFLARGVLSFAVSILIIWSLATTPFAEAMVLVSSAPILTCLLSPLLLGERAGLIGWLAVAIGFTGAVLILKPFGAVFGWTSLLPVAAAATLSAQDILTRHAHRTETGLSLLVATILLAIVGGSAFGWARGFVPVALESSGLLLLAGALAAFAFLAQILALRTLQATELAPLRYTALVWALLIGWIGWGELPDALSLAGGVLVVLAGLMVMRGR